jgi:hypothetical protein
MHDEMGKGFLSHHTRCKQNERTESITIKTCMMTVFDARTEGATRIRLSKLKDIETGSPPESPPAENVRFETAEEGGNE